MARRRTTALFAAIIVVSGIAVDPWGWDRYGPLRWALLSTLGLAMVAAGVSGGTIRLRDRPWFERWGLLLLLLGGLVSTIGSPDLLHAVIGTPDRHLGLVTWTIGAGVFVATLSQPPEVLAVGRTAAAVSLVLGVWTVLELADAGWFATSFADGRAGGPLGQPAYLGAAAVLFAPVGAVLLGAQDASAQDRRLAAWGLVAGLVAVAGSGSRAALVGVVVAGCTALARSRRAIGRGRVAAAAVGFTALTAVTPLGGRFVDSLRGGGLGGRIDEWQVGLRALWDAPALGVVGWGPEGYRTVFGRHVDDEYVVQYGREVFTDRAHSGPLDIALSIGWVGLLGWGLIVGGVCVAAWLARPDELVATALLAAVAGYAAQQLFLFPLAEVDLVLLGVLGLLAGQAVPVGRTQRRKLMTALVVALASLAAVAGMADVVADHAVAEDPVDAESARSLRPDSIRYRFISARAEPRGDVDSLRRALGHVLDGRDLSPADPALRVEEASVRVELARVGGDRADISAAAEVTARLLEDDPRHPQLLMQHGIALALDGGLDVALAPLERAVDLAPAAVEPSVNLAVVLREVGRFEDAVAVLEAVDRLSPGSPVVAALLLEISRE